MACGARAAALIGLLREVTDPRTTPGRRWDAVTGALALASVIAALVRTFGLGNPTLSVLRGVELATIAVLSADALLRQMVRLPARAFQPGRGALDAASLLPWWLGGPDTVGLRVLVVVRLLRVAHVREALDDLREAFERTRGVLAAFAVIDAVLLAVMVLAILDAEKGAQPERFGHAFDALWWAVVTLTTVGYGDVVPVTVAGRLVTMAALPVGIAMVGFPMLALAQAYAAVAARRYHGMSSSKSSVGGAGREEPPRAEPPRPSP